MMDEQKHELTTRKPVTLTYQTSESKNGAFLSLREKLSSLSVKQRHQSDPLFIHASNLKCLLCYFWEECCWSLLKHFMLCRLMSVWKCLQITSTRLSGYFFTKECCSCFSQIAEYIEADQTFSYKDVLGVLYKLLIIHLNNNWVLFKCMIKRAFDLHLAPWTCV